MPGIVQSLTREQCFARLSRQRIGWVSVSKDALPVIVPVLYIHDDAHIVFRAPLDPGFAALCDRAVIAFEVDNLWADENSGWSVHLVGVASILTPADELRQRGSGMLNPAGLETVQSACVAVERITGHQIDATPTVVKAS